jgi:hypothetical protein
VQTNVELLEHKRRFESRLEASFSIAGELALGQADRGRSAMPAQEQDWFGGLPS